MWVNARLDSHYAYLMYHKVLSTLTYITIWLLGKYANLRLGLTTQSRWWHFRIETTFRFLYRNLQRVWYHTIFIINRKYSFLVFFVCLTLNLFTRSTGLDSYGPLVQLLGSTSEISRVLKSYWSYCILGVEVLGFVNTVVSPPVVKKKRGTVLICNIKTSAL